MYAFNLKKIGNRQRLEGIRRLQMPGAKLTRYS